MSNLLVDGNRERDVKMIPIELLNKYNMLTLEEYRSSIDDTFTEEMFYKTFLIQTDHIPNKIIETLIEDLATATLVDFISVFINFIKNVRIEYKEVLECRKFARDEINRLEVSE